MKKNIFYTLCLLFLAGSLFSQQTVWVKVGASGTGDGSSEANAFTTIGAALLQIDSAGDVLRVVGNVPASNIALTLTSAGVSLNKNFAYTIEGDAGGSTLTGTAGATRMFTINSASVGHNVTFKNIKFTGANGSTGAGGGVLLCNQPATVKFENCIFDGNSLASTVTTGGGALNFTGTAAGMIVTITDCTFKNNTSPNIGGAIFSTHANLTITKTTFYNNKTLGTVGTIWGGAALYVGAGTSSVNSLTNCTFYQNTSTFPVAVNQDYGIIRTEAGNTTVTNCLFYDNKAAVGNPITSSSPSDWGCSATGTQTFNRSIGQWISNNVDNRTNFISFVKSTTNPLEVAANLTSSNLTWEDASNKVKFSVAPAGAHTPIAFGSDGKDVGAWDCGTRETPTFTQVAAICSGATLSALPTTSNNGITGTWSPALDNTTTTTYTFLPGVGQCALSTTMTITVTPATTTGSVTVSQNTPYTWAENNVTYTETTTTSVTTGCNTATLNFTLLGASAPTISTLTSNGTTAITQGCVGSTLVITGTDFLGASAVTVNGVAVASFTVNSSTQITAILSAGSVASGAVAVTTPAGTGTSAGNFAVNAQATPTFTQVAAICPGDSLSALPTTSNNSITGTWSPALNNAATTAYTFTPNEGQCATTATMTITVNSGVTPTFTQVATICAGASLSALPTTSDNSVTGTWSPALNSAATTTYTFTPTAGQCASTATMTITVNTACVKTFTWSGSASNDWATAANWTTTGDGPDTFPGQSKTTDIVVISNGGTPVVSSGTYGMISLAINNTTGGDTGSVLTINSGATLTVNNTAVVAIILKGGRIVNNGTLNATSTNTGASYGISCQVPSVAPSSATEYGYSGSGALNINTSVSTNASSGGIQFQGTLANTTYKMLFNGATTFNLNNTGLGVYALRVGDAAKGPIVIGGTGFTLGTVGVPVNYGLLSMGKDGNNVTVDTGTTLTLNSKSTNTAQGITIIQATAGSAADTFINKGTIAINGASTQKGINLNLDNGGQAAGTNKINFENQGTLNLALAVGGTNLGPFAVLGGGTNDGLVTITNSGTMNLSNTQPFTNGTGRPFSVTTAANTPSIIFNNSGTLTLSGEGTNYGGQAARCTLNNTGTITSNADFQQFTIANASIGTISFVPSGNRQATFTVATSVAAAVGATYTDANSNVFTVRTAKASASGTTLVTGVAMTAITPTTGTLTKTSGTGDDTIAYTAVALTVGNAIAAISSASNSGRINTGTGTSLISLPGLTTTTSTSVIAPGGDSGKAAINLAGTALAINGTLKLQVAGNTAAGIDYDQINNSTSLGSFNIAAATLDVTGIYTPDGPVTLDIVRANTTVSSEGTITGPFATVTGLAGSRWAVNYVEKVAGTTAGKVQLVYTPLPTITSLTSNGTETISQGCSGSTLVITGTNFTGASAVTINGVAVASYVVDSSTQITAVLPSSATSGVVVVTIPAIAPYTGETATSAGNFSVIATVTPTFTPVSAICYQGSLSALPETSTNGVTGTWLPALNNTATTEYTFTPDEGQCAASTATTMTIVVNALPELPSVACNQNVVWNPATCQYDITTISALNAGTDGTLTVCAGTTPTSTQLFEALTGEDAGGSWSNVGLVYTYTVVATAPCTGTDTATVTVTEQAAPNAGTDGALSLIASPSEAALFAAITGEDAGGTWTSPGSGFVGVYTYTVNATAPCTGSDTSTVTVTAGSVIPSSPYAVCTGTTVATATAGTTLKFYKDTKTTTAAYAGTIKLAALTYYVTETPVGGSEGPRTAVTVTLTALVAPTTIASTEAKLICKYMGTDNLVTFTTAPVGGANNYTWNVSSIAGAAIVGNATGESVTVSFEGVSGAPGLIGSVTVDSNNALGCPSGKPKALALTTKAASAPKTVALAINGVAVKKAGNFVGDASKTLTLTVTDPSLTADRYNFTLPEGVSNVTGATSVGGSTTLYTTPYASTSTVLTFNLGGVQASNTALAFTATSVAGCGSSSKTLSVARAEAGTPKGIVLTDATLATAPGVVPAVLPIVLNKLDGYTGSLKTRTLTLTATPNTAAGSEATSYKWVLPAAATIVGGTAEAVEGQENTYTSTSNVISVNLANVQAELVFTFKVFGVNGNGTSLASKDLACTSALPKAPAAIYAGTNTSLTGTKFTLYNTNCGTVTISVPEVLGVYNTLAVVSATSGNTVGITHTAGSNVATIDLASAGGTLLAKSAITIRATAYTATGSIFKDYVVKFGAACSAPTRIAPEAATATEAFSVVAYPNPATEGFRVKSSNGKSFGVQVYDMLGRSIEQRQMNSDAPIGSNYAKGIYNVIVNQGANVKTLRVIKN